MLSKSISLCCFLLSVQSQSQNPQFNQNYDPDLIYFTDNRPSALPLSSVPPIDKNVISQIFQNNPESEKRNEAFGANVVQANRPTGSRVVSRETNSVIIPSKQTTEQNLIDRQIASAASQHRPALSSSIQSAFAAAPTIQTTSRANGYNNLLYSVTNFGINLMKNVNSINPGNVAVSPFSITSLLGLLQQGAVGQTQQQITTALQMLPEMTVSAYSQLSADIKNRNSRNILKTANNLFIADGFSLNPNFKKIAVENFNSDLTPVSFARPDFAARQINSWVASRTNNKIERLISPDSVDVATQLVLVNAVYFKGLWEVPFKVESTIPRDFHLSNGQTKKAQFMRMRKIFKTGEDPTINAKVILLPFERDEYSLMVILPSKLVGLTSTLTSLTDARLLSYLSFGQKETELELPKFTVKADTDLAPILRNMGMTNMFSQYAELNGIGTFRAFSPQISSAVHSAVLSIDEVGGSAAAATAFGAVALSNDEPSVVFKVNRPFIAVLWDARSSLPLFMAKIEDPQL